MYKVIWRKSKGWTVAKYWLPQKSVKKGTSSGLELDVRSRSLFRNRHRLKNGHLKNCKWRKKVKKTTTTNRVCTIFGGFSSVISVLRKRNCWVAFRKATESVRIIINPCKYFQLRSHVVHNNTQITWKCSVYLVALTPERSIMPPPCRKPFFKIKSCASYCAHALF